MDSTLELAERQIAEQLSNLAREAEIGPSAPPTSMKTSRAPLATVHQLANWRYLELANWRYLAFVCSLVAVSVCAAAWRWSSSAHTATMAPSDAAPPTQALPEAVVPSSVALSSDFAQQLQPMTRDLAALRQDVEQLKLRQEQLVRDNENVVSQLKASQEETARNNSTIDEIKAIQIQMARENQTLTERLNASQEQLARVIANASAPKVTSEESKVSPEEPKVMPEIPLPRPRRSASVAQAPKPGPTPARAQAGKPQPSFAWPWSAR
ncbi:hypothetical protein [Bradyrhizobium sp. Ai1a-2]|uniref:hypothetical protein n=1 Tax=Bradyrhizobium sp. Ai1a-2 TaxID=196490 RepID=UPI0004123EAE|nr:hypothetical protein [Bradyrhizobium sp. Ai1a-2]